MSPGEATMRWACLAAILGWLVGSAWAQDAVPAGFVIETLHDDFLNPVDLAIAADGRIFVADQRGLVYVVQDGAVLEEVFVDLREEVQLSAERGLIGIALDPNFIDNHHVYLGYVVDPIFGPPNDPDDADAFSRVVRYTGTQASGGNVADPDSRLVLIGNDGSDGIPVLHTSHTVDSLRFGEDGSLLVSAGDGAQFEFADAGGNDPGCCDGDPFPPDQDIGAFRSQYLSSLDGKILRIDPATGAGLADNPYFTGEGFDLASRVWASGLRNPFRFCVRPGTGSETTPGTLYIGDVGWNDYEELCVAHGGENFGWPCYEGPALTSEYPTLSPPFGSCAEIETESNPGPLAPPLVALHHFNTKLSSHGALASATIIGGQFYTGTSYPLAYRDALFLADFYFGWVYCLRVDENDQVVSFFEFGTISDGPAAFAVHPQTGDLYYIALYSHAVKRIRFEGPLPGDLDGDLAVGAADLAELLAQWGACEVEKGCAADLAPPPPEGGDGVIDAADLAALLANWG
jgi:glucose/arabinose dehydrogenase